MMTTTTSTNFYLVTAKYTDLETGYSTDTFYGLCITFRKALDLAYLNAHKYLVQTYDNYDDGIIDSVCIDENESTSNPQIVYQVRNRKWNPHIDDLLKFSIYKVHPNEIHF